MHRIHRVAALATTLLVACAAEDLGSNGPGGKADGFASFEDFKASLPCYDDGQRCIFNGDLVIIGDEALRRIYLQIEGGGQALSVYNIDDVDMIWDRTQRFDLSYCVSPKFGFFKPEVVEAMADAARDWESLADVRFRYVPEEDDLCNVRNPRIVFPVIPGPDDEAYIASAFFPGYPKEWRRVDVNLAEFTSFLVNDELGGNRSLRGIMRHELGHVLGFRHEHIRPENALAGCFESSDFRPLTVYDSKSVMHYPQCDGAGDWSLEFSELDREGARFFYPDFSKYVAGRCPDEVRPDGTVNEACEPIVHEILELANTASFEVLDQWAHLDVRATNEIVLQRDSAPYVSLAQLRGVKFLGEVTVRRMYDYLYVDGRCPSELDAVGFVDVRCRPVVHRILALANTASFKELDIDVGLDVRAVANIEAIRTYTPFVDLAELWAVPYVKTMAVMSLYDYLFPDPPSL